MSPTDDDGVARHQLPDECELPDEEVDARFRELTADLPDPVVDFPEPTSRTRGPRDWPTTPEVEELEEAQSHFTPPVPPPMRARDRWTHIAWVALSTSLALLLATLFIPRTAIASQLVRWLGFVASAGFTASVVFLISRMPRVRRHDDEGAVV